MGPAPALAQAPDEKPEAASSVLFVLPASANPDVHASLRKAVEAQFAGLSTSLVFETFEAAAPDLSLRAQAVRELARRHSARAVFWIETAGDDWLLYMTEPEAERILVRRFSLAGSSQTAAEETVSVITRESAAALLSGHTIGMQPVVLPDAGPPAPPSSVAEEPRPVPTPAPPKAKPERRGWEGIWVDVGYAGTSFAQEARWQSGVAAGVRWVSRTGFFSRVGYVFTEVLDVRTSIASIEVVRHPIEAAAGFRFSEDRTALRIELGYILDIVTREAFEVRQGFEQAPPDTRWISAVAPRLGLEIRLTDHVSVSAAAGLDLVLDRVEYVARVGDVEHLLLNPHSIRASGGIGLGFLP